ncbi:hypothetical protein [uncultured Clostridium sp.]|uniref:hypothetical protein n=1 Tax=uncultured Clostridium sp. TaxID=59620 RepID=UPI0025E62F09|nr:hypothetical protein [uncultured Clostridium sp.]
MTIIYLIIYILISFILSKAIGIGIVILPFIIIGKSPFKLNEEKWEEIIDKIKFKGIFLVMLILFVVGIIITSFISKFIWQIIFNRIIGIETLDKFYLIIPLILFIRLIYKCIFKRDELYKIANNFNNKKYDSIEDTNESE